MTNDFICVETSPHARAWAQPASDPHDAWRLFLAEPPTHEADFWGVTRACDAADRAGHYVVRALGNFYDSREVLRLLDASGIHARAVAGYRRGAKPLFTPYALGLSAVSGCLVVRDAGGAFALAQCAEKEGAAYVPIAAALLCPGPAAPAAGEAL